MRLDAPGCCRMCSDAFGCGDNISKKIHRCAHVHTFSDGFKRFGICSGSLEYPVFYQGGGTFLNKYFSKKTMNIFCIVLHIFTSLGVSGLRCPRTTKNWKRLGVRDLSDVKASTPYDAWRMKKRRKNETNKKSIKNEECLK